LRGCSSDGLEDEMVEPDVGDVLLGLDLSGDMLIQANKSGLFREYRNRGVSVYATVFDLLPVQLPDVFPPGADQTHRQWLAAISSLDGAVCISKTVADDLHDWQNREGYEWKNRRPFSIDWFHLGADVGSSAPTQGLPSGTEAILKKLRACASFLMVGTIEPRKGYPQVIDAFTRLWNEGAVVNLVIIGREGWKGLPDAKRRDIPETVKRLHNHPELDKHLFFMDGISDEFLEKVYAACTCLIAASYGEGFGLPLIEAAQHQLPIISRDIPVSSEVAGEYAFYFDATEALGLAQSLKTWLELYEGGAHPKSNGMSWLTWKESARQLSKTLLR
jgi:glycosyltransferase involved in cell wall biosynthesis